MQEPSDRRVKYGNPFYYDLNATASAGIDSWWLNSTINFSIDSEGVIRNVSQLPIGSYGLQVWVNDTLSNVISAEFTVEILRYGDWTVLVYLDGDNYLERYAFTHFNELELVGSTNHVNLITYVDFKRTGLV